MLNYHDKQALLLHLATAMLALIVELSRLCYCSSALHMSAGFTSPAFLGASQPGVHIMKMLRCTAYGKSPSLKASEEVQGTQILHRTLKKQLAASMTRCQVNYLLF